MAFILSEFRGQYYYWTIQNNDHVVTLIPRDGGSPDLNWNVRLGKLYYKNTLINTYTNDPSYNGFLTNNQPNFKAKVSTISSITFEPKIQYNFNWYGAVSTTFRLNNSPRATYRSAPNDETVQSLYRLGVGALVSGDRLTICLCNTGGGFVEGKDSVYSTVNVATAANGTPIPLNSYPTFNFGNVLQGTVLPAVATAAAPIISYGLLFIIVGIILFIVAGIAIFYGTRRKYQEKPFTKQLIEDGIQKKLLSLA